MLGKVIHRDLFMFRLRPMRRLDRGLRGANGPRITPHFFFVLGKWFLFFSLSFPSLGATLGRFWESSGYFWGEILEREGLCPGGIAVDSCME